MCELRILKYLRLSIDDESEGESNSIIHQRELIDNFINEKFKGQKYKTDEIADDGFSGTNFNRPGITRALELLNKGSYNCLIVKDFSRFGRDHIQVGNYLEHIFPALDVRVISVNDTYDSGEHIGTTGGIDVAIKNLIYELYSKDLSQKVRAARITMMKTGKYNAPFSIFGYLKHNDSLIIDTGAAAIVQRIFNAADSGMKTSEIAALMNKENVLTPSKYKKSKNCIRNWEHSGKTIAWNDGTVRRILQDEKYTGKMVLGKTQRMKVGDACSSKKKPKDSWIVVENTHTPIVSQEQFDRVAERLHKSCRPNINCIKNRSLYFCGSCGHALIKTGKVNIKLSCHYSKMCENNDCLSEVTYQKDINEVLKNILSIQFLVMGIAADNYKKLLHSESSFSSEDINAEIARLKKQRFSAYECYKNKDISKDEFETIRNEVQTKIDDLEQKLDLSDAVIEENQFKTHKADIILNYNIDDGIDEKFIEYFVKSVKVYNNKKIEIEWKFGLEEFLEMEGK